MDRITEALREIIKKEGKTVYRVAKDIGVDFPFLCRALKNGGNLVCCSDGLRSLVPVDSDHSQSEPSDASIG